MENNSSFHVILSLRLCLCQSSATLLPPIKSGGKLGNLLSAPQLPLKYTKRTQMEIKVCNVARKARRC